MSAISVAWLSISWGAVNFETNCGLMQHSPYEIKEKLLNALDKEYNVVDYATVFEVVTDLERIPITTEILEATRLGKHINEFRRKTSNEALAKRAKDLVRRWRHMIDLAAASGSSSVSSHQQNGTPVVRPGKVEYLNNHHHHHHKLATSSDPKVESVPKTHASNKRLRKDTAPEFAAEVSTSKRAKLNGSLAGHSKHFASSSPPPVHVQNILHNHNSIDFNNELPSTHQASSSTNQLLEVVRDSQEQVLPKRRRGKKKDAKKNYDIVKEKLKALSKSGKVKTTQELVNDLKSRSDDLYNNSPHLASPTIEGDKEVIIIESESQGTSGRNFESKPRVYNNVEDEIQSILSKLPPLDVDSIVWSSDDDDAGNFEDSSPPKPIFDYEDDEQVNNRLERNYDDLNNVCNLNEENIDGVNGTLDHNNQFKEWHEMVTKKTYNDEIIHILPYAIVD